MADTIIKTFVTRFKTDIDEAAATQTKRTIVDVAQDWRKLSDRVNDYARSLRQMIGSSARAYDEYADILESMETVVGISREQIKAWGQDFKRIGFESTIPLHELADAMYDVTSAGYRSQEALDILEASAKAARIGLGSTKDIVDLATSATKAYGKENITAATATDVLVKSVEVGKFKPEQLANNIKRLLPTAKELGIGFAEVSASMSQLSLTDSNMERAATNIEALLIAITKPTFIAKKELQRLNEAGKDVPATFKELRKDIEKDFLGTMLRLKKATDGNLESFAKLTGSTTGLKAALSLTGGEEEAVKSLFNTIQNENLNAVDIALAKTRTGLSDFTHAIDTLKVSFGEALIDGLQPLIKGFLRLARWIVLEVPTGLKIVSFSIGTLAAVLTTAGVALNIFSTAFTALSATMNGGAFKQSVAQVVKSIKLIKNTAVLAFAKIKWSARLAWGATGIGLLIVAASLIIEHWDKVYKFIKPTLTWLKDRWDNIWKTTESVVSDAYKVITEIWSRIKWFFSQAFTNFFETIADGVVGLFQGVIETIKQTAIGTTSIIKSFLLQDYVGLAEAATKTGSKIGQAWKDAFSDKFESWTPYHEWLAGETEDKDEKKSVSRTDSHTDSDTIENIGLDSSLSTDPDTGLSKAPRRPGVAEYQPWRKDFDPQFRWNISELENLEDELDLGPALITAYQKAMNDISKLAEGSKHKGLIDAIMGSENSMAKKLTEKLGGVVAKAKDFIGPIFQKIGLSALPGGAILSALGLNPAKIVNKLFKGIRSLFRKKKRDLHDSGKDLIGAFRDGLNKGMKEHTPIKFFDEMFYELRRRLPSSDAEIGPLSDLTFSGRMFSETLAKGIKQGLPVLEESANSIVSNLAAPKEINPYTGTSQGQQVITHGSHTFNATINVDAGNGDPNQIADVVEERLGIAMRRLVIEAQPE